MPLLPIASNIINSKDKGVTPFDVNLAGLLARVGVGKLLGGGVCQGPNNMMGLRGQ